MNQKLDEVVYRCENQIGSISDDKILLKSIGVNTFGRVTITFIL